MERARAVVLLVSTLLWAGCVTTPAQPDDEDDPVSLETSITSTSVRIERARRGPATALIDRRSEVGEVFRVLELLAERGARRVRLKVETGAEAVVSTLRPDGAGQWLVVTIGDDGFKVFVTSAEGVGRPAAELARAEGSLVPLRDGKLDLERLASLSRALTHKLGKLGGATVAAPSRAPADRAVETLEQLKRALPDAPRRTLLAL